MRNISHPSVLKLAHAWVDRSRKSLIILSEFFSESNLQAYIKSLPSIPDRQTIGNWCGQLLDGLEQFHINKPPLIHGYIKCSNIQIDPNTKAIKLGLPNLNYYAFGDIPELSEIQEGSSSTKSDVWALGLCVIEMSTGLQPYSECDSSSSLKNTIRSGVMPQAFTNVSDPIIADFISTCMLPVEQRPTVSQLKEHALICGSQFESQKSASGQSSGEISKVSAAKQSPEFLELLKRQKEETEFLLQQQKNERKQLRKRIRESAETKKSLRELLDHVI
ncbi:STE family protein kinase [Histomonas meleagridis]|uniref:STE family protein kinase n=1 Tax=Histomonas meleagridis TaxID=135588 RepID=UPI003559BA45|nr:STE family protein kinase [Histomonas meleagridis]KAH0804768.1 STE family protein kinase [Histomonas meleagridis]